MQPCWHSSLWSPSNEQWHYAPSFFKFSRIQLIFLLRNHIQTESWLFNPRLCLIMIGAMLPLIWLREISFPLLIAIGYLCQNYQDNSEIPNVCALATQDCQSLVYWVQQSVPMRFLCFDIFQKQMLCWEYNHTSLQKNVVSTSFALDSPLRRLPVLS